MFSGFPHVGDIVLSEDTEKLERLFKMLKSEIANRKQKLVAYNGDYELFLKSGNETMPMIIVMINEYGSFLQTNPVYEEQITSLTKDAMKYGIVFIISASAVNEVKSGLVQNFKRKIALQLIGDDYSYVFSKARRKRPSSYSGRGLVLLNNEGVYEFQTTSICKAENINVYLKKVKEKLVKVNTKKAPEIPVLPKIVTIELLKDYMGIFRIFQSEFLQKI